MERLKSAQKILLIASFLSLATTLMVWQREIAPKAVFPEMKLSPRFLNRTETDEYEKTTDIISMGKINENRSQSPTEVV